MIKDVSKLQVMIANNLLFSIKKWQKELNISKSEFTRVALNRYIERLDAIDSVRKSKPAQQQPKTPSI